MTTKTKQLLTIIGVINLIFIAVYIGLFIWLRAASLDTNSLARDLAQRSEQESQLTSAIELLRATTHERSQIQSYFVTEDTIVEIITELESLSTVAHINLTVGSVSLDEPLNTESSQRLSVRLATRGGWQETIHLLMLLESLPRALVVSEASLSHASGEVGEVVESNVWVGNIVIEAFVRPEKS